jgi:hypothetical protein
VAAERGRSAGLNRRHHTPLDPTEMLVMPIAERCAVAAEDIRHLQHRTHHGRSGRRSYLKAQMVERTQRALDRAGRNLCIARRGVDVAMTEQRLNDPDVGASFQQMGGEAVPQRVDGDRLLSPAAAQAGRQAAFSEVG